MQLVKALQRFADGTSVSSYVVRKLFPPWYRQKGLCDRKTFAPQSEQKIPPSVRERYPEVPWKSIAGMRDRIAHVYFGIDLDIVWNTVKEKLPELRPVIQSILENIEDLT